MSFKYDPKSLIADEFINHEEIMACLAYADAHKNDKQLLDEILAKAEERNLSDAPPPRVHSTASPNSQRTQQARP